jgi:PPP family 3-phenylpropionic acid transporter
MIQTDPPKSFRLLFFMYLFFFGAVGIYMTYINVYYLAAGLSGTQIGLVSTAASLVGFGAASLWGYISDRTGQARIILAVSGLGTAIVASITPFVHSFAGFLGLACGFSLFTTALFTLTDSVTINILGDRSSDYGRYRMGGSLGFILTSAVSGFVFQKVGLVWMFPVYTVIILVFALIATRLPRLAVRQTTRSGHALGTMMRNPTWIIFAGSIFLVWLASSGVISFLGVTMKALGSSDTLIGLASAMVALMELPFMALSGWFLRKLGPSRMIWISLFAYTVRIFLYSRINSAIWVIPLNLVNGPSYVLFWTGSINYAAALAPESLKATSQGLIISIINLSSVAGVLLSGWLYDHLGPTGLYWVLSLFCLAAFGLFGLGRTRKVKTW